MPPIVRDPIHVAEWVPQAPTGLCTAPPEPAAAKPTAPPAPLHLAANGSAAATAAAAPSGLGSAQLDAAGILEKRRRHVGPNLALFFQDEPLHVVRGSGCELFDAEGTAYLDCINNVSHVGHAHPRVAAATGAQLSTLNTNSRYLSQGLVDYAEALVKLLPDPLQVVYMTVSGSEANDLAWRIACTVARAAQAVAGDTRPLHVACIDHAYHGHTSACIDISPYKFKGPGGMGRPVHVHVLPCPDTYRGENLDGAAAARAAIAAAEAAGGRLAAFFSESILSCGGQVFLPEGYLAGVYREMRAVGAVCVADEVQCGFGRVGRAFWAFELQGVVPDIVTFGKPCGNGFPMAGLVTTPQLAQGFAGPGMEFFATFGGCTAAPACGLAVLQVMREEGLQQNAAAVGAYCLARLRELQAEHPEVIGDVRGEGLMLGVELVTDGASRAPSPALARHLKTHAKRAHRVLLSTEGPFSNVIKVKPPLCFNTRQADAMVAALRDGLARLGPEQRAVLAEASRREAAEVAARLARLS
ncbi:hypothetical protein ABPG75_006257 [Micractinium tetrahymenae]